MMIKRMNKTFKDFLIEDLDVFFNPDEFAEEHELDGDTLLCVIVNNKSLSNRDGMLREQIYASQEVYQEIKTVYIKASLFYIPKVESLITLDGKEYYVEAASENKGIIRITLTANES